MLVNIRAMTSSVGGAVSGLALLALLCFSASGCRPNDLGTDCRLHMPVCPEELAPCDEDDIVYEEFEPDDPNMDFIATGVVDCDHFVCVSSAGFEETPYCSRRCLDNEQCRGGVLDLECRELVLDPEFIADLCDQLGPEGCERIFFDIKDAFYCAMPR